MLTSKFYRKKILVVSQNKGYLLEKQNSKTLEIYGETMRVQSINKANTEK